MKNFTVRLSEDVFEILNKLSSERGVSNSIVIREAIKNTDGQKEILKRLDALESELRNEKALARNIQTFLNSAYCRYALEQLIKTTNLGGAVDTNFNEFKKREGIR